jgi:hypothetical protein
VLVVELCREMGGNMLGVCRCALLDAAYRSGQVEFFVVLVWSGANCAGRLVV